MEFIYFEDPGINARRYYGLDVQSDLFGQIVLVRSWGRIGTRGVIKIEPYETVHAAELARFRLFRSKVKKGYRARRR